MSGRIRLEACVRLSAQLKSRDGLTGWLTNSPMSHTHSHTHKNRKQVTGPSEGSLLSSFCGPKLRLKPTIAEIPAVAPQPDQRLRVTSLHHSARRRFGVSTPAAAAAVSCDLSVWLLRTWSLFCGVGGWNPAGCRTLICLAAVCGSASAATVQIQLA